MAVYITLFNFEKVNNSTKRPKMDDGTRFECRINMPCTVTRPNVALVFGDNSVYPDYNYCYIDQFHRYYFISEWTYTNGLWFADCRVDTLASWWDDLKDSTQYVTRNAAVFDTYCQDLLYPATTKCTFQTITAESPFEQSYSSGMFIVGIIGGGGNRGCISYYGMTYSQFNSFTEFLFGDAFFRGMDLEEVALQTFKLQFNPIQYVASCFWFPYPSSFLAGMGTAVSTITFGWWELPGNATALSTLTMKRTLNFAIPSHPQVGRGKYMDGAPFTRLTLSLPGFGEIPLDSSALVDSKTLSCDIVSDFTTGKSKLTIKNASGVNPYQLSVERANLSMNLALSQSGLNIVAAGASAGSIVGSTMVGGAGIGESVGNFVNNMFPQVRTTGSTGSLSEYVSYPCALYCQFVNVVDDDPTHRGKPLCMDKQLDTLTGFTMVADANISLPATEKEREQLKFLMEGGFYIE